MEKHLKERYFNYKLYENTVYWDDKTVCFQLYSLTGNFVGFQKYTPSASKKPNNKEHGRYYTYITKPYIGFFGVHTLHWNNGPIFLCEGIFDICRFHNKSYAGLAVFSNNPKHLRNSIDFLKQTKRPIITVCDGDKAGKMLAKYGTFSISCPENKDAGELTESELDNILTQALKKIN